MSEECSEVGRLVDVEMIRDGGSFAASFDGPSGRKILFFKIKHDLSTRPPTRSGYEAPVMIDGNPALRPPDTSQGTHSDLSGPRQPVSWEYARQLLAAPFDDGRSGTLQSAWHDQMRAVAAHDGRTESDDAEPASVALIAGRPA